MTAEAEKPFTIYNLVSALEEYTRRHRYDRDVKERWFAEHLETVILPRARRIRSGGIEDAEKTMVTQFRLAEIEEEKAKRQNEIDKLDSEARKLAAAAA